MRVPIQRAAVAVVAGMLIAGLAGGTVSAASTGRSKMAGQVPSWAKAANLKSATAGSERLGFRVYLGWSNAAGAEAFAAAVSNPRSASYGKYLTPAQFRQRYSRSATQVKAVQTWLRSQGFTVDYTPSNRLYVSAEGTVAQAAKAFKVSFGNYHVNGLTLRSPKSAISVPSSLARTIEAVSGLDESAALVRPAAGKAAPPPDVFVNGQPCSTYWDEIDTSTPANGTTLPDIYGSPTPYAPCGYTPQQVRGAYGVPDALTGSGVTVAIIDAYASPTIVNDVQTWSAARGIAGFKPGQFSQIVAPGTYHRPQNKRQDPQGWSGEETLDIEAVHGMAPDAKVVYVGAPNNYQDLDAALNHVVDRHVADIVTNSYGWAGEALPNGFVKPYHDILVQAAAQGIGIYFSSGDSGDETGGDPANAAAATADAPASDPFVTAVGGTSIGIDQNDGIAVETGWESGTSTYDVDTDAWTPAPPGDYLYGGGGGTSHRYVQPSYQAGIVPDSMSQAYGSTKMRVVPDVSALGDPNTGFLVGQTQTFPDGTAKYSEYRIGGTSLSSPIFAGMMADLQQSKGAPIGFANPLLYSLPAGAFHDIVHVANAGVVRSNFVNSVDASDGYAYIFRSFDFTTGLTIHTVPGYDNVTGRGTINGATFFQ